MPNSPKGGERAPLPLVSIPEMPDRLEQDGVKRVGAARIRQLVIRDPAFPAPVYERGHVRLWDWSAVLAYFKARTSRQGERTDLAKKRPQEDPPRASEDEDRRKP